MEAVDEQDQRDAEGAEKLHVHPDLRDIAHHLGPRDVQPGLDSEQDQCDDQDRPVMERVEVPPEPVVGERRHVGDHAGVDRGDRDQQGDAVEPAHEPAVARADRELRVLVQSAGHRIVAAELAEHERHEQHPDHRDDGQPQVTGSTRAHAEQEQRVDADHRREVGEGDRKVSEQPEDAVQLRRVAEVGQPPIVVGGEPRATCTNRLHPVLLSPRKCGADPNRRRGARPGNSR